MLYVLSVNMFACFVDFLLSNNHVNSIISHQFDFTDEEVGCFCDWCEPVLTQPMLIIDVVHQQRDPYYIFSRMGSRRR